MNQKDPRVIKTLERISNAVLFNLERYPFREITLNMICQDAMINKTTFYKYYRDKYDYLNQYLNLQMERFHRQLDAAFILASPEDVDSPVYQEAFARLLRHIYGHRREYLILWRAGIDRQIYDEMGEAIYDTLLAKILDSHAFDCQPRIHLELYARLFAFHTMTLLHWWFHHEEEVTMDDVLRLMTDNMRNKRLKISSRFLRNPAEMILLSPGTDAPRNLSPVTDAPRNAPGKCLLLFHGAGESGQTILDNSALADMSETLNLRVALPFLGNSFGLDCGEGEQVHAFLTQELFPYLRDVLFAPSGTFCVGGISMGAFIALSLGLERRDVVSGVFSVSGAFDLRKAARFGRVCGLEIPPAVADMEARPGEWTRRLLERCAGRAALPLYFACGDGDLFYDTNRVTANRARALGYSVRWEARPGLHNWDYWRGALSDALQWVAGNGR